MSELFGFASRYIQFNPKSAANIIQQFSISEIHDFLSELDENSLVQVLSSMDPVLVSSLLVMLPEAKTKLVLGSFPLNFIAHILQTSQDEYRLILTNLLSEQVKKHVERRMQYLPDTAGSYMDSRIVYFNASDPVTRCVERFKKKARTFYYVYITDDEGTLVGVTTIRRLLEEENQDVLCSQIMDSPVESIKIDHNANEIIQNPAWSKYSCLPVVDYQEKFLGVINHGALNKIKSSILSDKHNQDVRSVGNALSELYSIGFTALIGSASSVPEVGHRNE